MEAYYLRFNYFQLPYPVGHAQLEEFILLGKLPFHLQDYT